MINTPESQDTRVGEPARIGENTAEHAMPAAAPSVSSNSRRVPPHPNATAFNASFDLTMLEVESKRRGVATLLERLEEIRPVIDPFVLDKKMDTYRRGQADAACLGRSVRCPA